MRPNFIYLICGWTLMFSDDHCIIFINKLSQVPFVEIGNKYATSLYQNL